MSQLPITSRIKRSPLLKGSPYKQTETPDASVVAPGEDKNIKGKKGTPKRTEKEAYELRGPEYKDMDFAAYQKVMRKDPLYGTSGTPDQPDQVVKGDDVIAPTYSKRQGDAQTNFEARQLARQTKFKNRYVRQSRNKLAKAEDKMANFQKKYSKPGIDKETGKPTSTFTAPKPGEKGYRQYMRLDSKVSENKKELADFEAGSSNQAEVMRSGKTIGKSYRMDEDRRDTAADQTPDQRIAQVRAEQEAANNIVSEGQGSKAVEVNNSATTTATEDTPADTTQYGEYETKPAPTNMRSAFKMKAKSPAAKKLQGNQGRLPQHLQDAIKSAPESPAKLGPLAAIAGKALVGALASKAVSSNKMRSGFKMKGYGKK